jgi:hypothetical protein
MHLGQRKEIRSIVTQQPHGKLQVLLGDQSLDVFSVKDVSPTGIRVEIGNQINIGENILVRYLTEKVDLKLNGTVVWNSGLAGSADSLDQSLAFLIGIKLTSPSLLQTLW